MTWETQAWFGWDKDGKFISGLGPVPPEHRPPPDTRTSAQRHWNAIERIRARTRLEHGDGPVEPWPG